MSVSTLPYPHSPSNGATGRVKLSKQFKKQVFSVIYVITLFFITYVGLMVAAIAIAILSGIAGFYIMTLRLHFLTLVFGAALIGSGLMLVYFVLKFAFKRKRRDYSGMLEITEADSPQLFEFIRKLTAETGARLPKHVYLSADVNASVFYDSSFWSMFLPVRKNLLIGLGLVNTLNQSEFKAVLAHEFGHFSQRSMKFGSYVYNLNNIVYNMLYENDGYMTVIHQFAKTHSVVQFAAYINIYMVRGIQFVLRKVYVVMNKSYMGLSREMEFHADSISASVSGGNHLISSLRRLDAADECYNTLVNFLNDELRKKNKINNLYPLHRELLKLYASKHELELDQNEIPIISKAGAELNFMHIELSNPWASHPTNAERENHLNTLQFHADTSSGSAWALFDQAEEIQEQMTELLYTNTQVPDKLEQKELNHFMALVEEDRNNNSFNPQYKGYYDGRTVSEFDPELVAEDCTPVSSLTLQELLSFSNCTLPRRINALSEDIAKLDAVADEKNKIKAFKLDNVIYQRNDVEQVKAKLGQELEQLKAGQQELDEQIFSFCYRNAANADLQLQLIDGYRHFFKQQKITQQDADIYQMVMELLQQTATRLPYNQIETLMHQLYEAENPLKARFDEIITNPVYTDFITKEFESDIKKYLSQRWNYFHHKEYDNMALGILKSALQAYISVVVEANYKLKKELLNFQLQIIGD